MTDSVAADGDAGLADDEELPVRLPTKPGEDKEFDSHIGV